MLVAGPSLKKNVCRGTGKDMIIQTRFGLFAKTRIDLKFIPPNMRYQSVLPFYHPATTFTVGSASARDFATSWGVTGHIKLGSNKRSTPNCKRTEVFLPG